MPATRSSKKPPPPANPANRIYASAPTLKQKRFPGRKRTVKSSPMFASNPRPSRQDTLTQIGFAHILPDPDDENMTEAPDSPPQARKRRSLEIDDARARKKRQSTLTQIGFFAQLEDSEDENLSPEEENYQSQSDQEDILLQPSTEQYSPRNTPSQSPCNRLFAVPHTPVKQEPRHTPSPFRAPQPPTHNVNLPTAVFKTPSKPIKREVPNSQSPAATPLSLYDATPDVSPSPIKPQIRSPLQAIPENIIAMRDSVVATPGKGGKIKQAAVTSTGSQSSARQAPMAEDMDLDLDDQENEDPYVDCDVDEKSSNTKLLQQLDDYSKKRKQNSSPYMLRSANLRRQSSPPAPSLHNPHKLSPSYSALSQATTAPTTQSSPNSHINFRKPPTPTYHSTLPPLPPPVFLDEESQFALPPMPSSSSTAAPFSIFSDEDDDEDTQLRQQMAECSPLSFAQDTQDMPTVSQLIGDWTGEVL